MQWCVWDDDATEPRAGRTSPRQGCEENDFFFQQSDMVLKRGDNSVREEERSTETAAMGSTSLDIIVELLLKVPICNFRSWLRPNAICHYYIFPFGLTLVKSSELELSSIMRLKWYKKPNGLLRALLFECSDEK